MRKIFVLSGLSGGGKTTFGQMVYEELQSLKIPFLHTSSIDPIKNIMMNEDLWWPEFKDNDEFRLKLQEIKSEITSDDWDGQTKDAHWRKVMSDIKLKVLEEFPDFLDAWVLSRALFIPDGSVIFVDIREPSSIKRFKEYCDMSEHDISVRAIFISGDVGEMFDNRSDKSIYDFNYDFVIENIKANGLKGLREKVNYFIQEGILHKGLTKERDY